MNIHFTSTGDTKENPLQKNDLHIFRTTDDEILTYFSQHVANLTRIEVLMDL